MAHGGYDGGGQCLLQFTFFFPVQRHQPWFFLPHLLLFSSSPFGLCFSFFSKDFPPSLFFLLLCLASVFFLCLVLFLSSSPFCCAVLVRLWWIMAVAAGRSRRWADAGVGSAGAALSPPFFSPLSPLLSPFSLYSLFSFCRSPPCSFSFFLPATLCFFFHVLSSSVLLVFFLPMLSLTLLLYPLSISSLSRSFFFFFFSPSLPLFLVSFVSSALFLFLFSGAAPPPVFIARGCQHFW